MARWLRELVGPTPSGSNYLSPVVVEKRTISGGVPEKMSFLSEDGQYIPGLLWLRYEPEQALDSKVLLDWLNPKADQVHH